MINIDADSNNDVDSKPSRVQSAFHKDSRDFLAIEEEVIGPFAVHREGGGTPYPQCNGDCDPEGKEVDPVRREWLDGG